MDTLGICLALAAATAPPVFVPAERFTLAWTHSIEKVRWEEDYAVMAGAVGADEAAANEAVESPAGRPTAIDAAPPRLHAVAARVRGSAAGMEPPEGARLVDGWYTYTPALPYPTGLRLTRSAYTADYELCVQGACRPMANWLPSDGDITLLTACRSVAGR
ncbi:MAG: DUF1850 domain-containing protein [Hydrogenophaga sp.]|jgi:hypothetical protein|nr:DUF1850 domain-containing protein [Hydrogenophaga sp.]